MPADRPAPPRAPARRAGQLGAPAGRGASASSSSPTGTRSPPAGRTPAASRASTHEMVLDWLAVGLDPDARRALRPVGGQGARRAAPAAVDDRADAVAAAQPDHQGAGARARPARAATTTTRDEPAQLRPARLSGAAVGRHPASTAPRGVPVGIDQVPHLELTREVARRFNHLYGEVLPEPEALLTESPKIPGTDGRKMSKSYNNAVFLSEPPAGHRAQARPHGDRPAPRAPHRPGRSQRLPGLQPAPHLLHAGRDRSTSPRAAAPPASAASTARRS